MNLRLLALAAVAAATAVVLWRRRRRQRFVAAYERAGGQEGERLPFPYLAPCLPPPAEMLRALKADRPRRLRCEGAWAGCAAVITRDAADALRADALADHYTEGDRVAVPLRGLQGLWADRARRQALVRRAAHAAGDWRAPLVRVRRLLEAAGAAENRLETDTNPAFAAFVLRRAARLLRCEPRELKVVDAGAGWGGQLLGACAAGVASYRAFVPYGAKQAPAARLAEAAEAHRPAGAGFVALSMELGQARLAGEADVVLLGTGDLTPLLPLEGERSEPALTALRPGGAVVLFVPPGGARRALAVSTLLGVPRKVYGLEEEGGRRSRALLWVL